MSASAATVVGVYTGTTWTARWFAQPGAKVDGEWVHEGPSGEPGCWTFHDEQGFGPSLGYASNRHATPEAALASAAERDILVAAQGIPLTRAGYDVHATRLGSLPTWSDTDCRGMVDGDWDLATYGVLGAAARTLAARRGRAIRDEERAPVWDGGLYPHDVPRCRSCHLTMLADDLNSDGICGDGD